MQLHFGLTRRSSGRQHWPCLRHLHGQCWCPPLAALLPAPLTLGVRLSSGNLCEADVIFAELDYSGTYESFHSQLGAFLEKNFQHLESGLEGDSYFWIFDGDDKVAIDTFTSMKHQVKASAGGPHVQKVLYALAREFNVKVLEQPQLEGHEST
jgi:hypothetical protein